FQHGRVSLGETGRLVLQGGGDGAAQGVALCFEQLDFACALGHRPSLSCPAPPPATSPWASATNTKPTHRRQGVGFAYRCNWNSADRPSSCLPSRLAGATRPTATARTTSLMRTPGGHALDDRRVVVHQRSASSFRPMRARDSTL